VLIAVLGSPHSAAAELIAYRRAGIVIAAIAFAGGVAGFGILAAKRSHADAASEAAATAA
jgi:hypothetical protein